MSKSAGRFDESQLSIFDAIRRLTAPEEDFGEGSLSIREGLRAAIRASVKGCALSMHQIAGEMSHLCGETITKEMIYSWTRESDELNGRPVRHIPAEYLPALCRVTGSNRSIEVLGKSAELFVLPGPEALRAEIQRIDDEIRKAQSKKRRRLSFLREMEGQ